MLKEVWASDQDPPGPPPFVVFGETGPTGGERKQSGAEDHRVESD